MSDPPASSPARFPRRRVDRAAERPDLPPGVDDLGAFVTELAAIERRIERVLASGRAAFSDGSDSYDHASMAIIRLAALFEDERFHRSLSSVSETERRGIATTRNVVAHHGYRAMDDERFWRTITIDVPALLRRVHP